ncbi:MAG TPA: IS630 family transposase [Acidimicrobiales bacterium]|nr:IS630 family transposase [Acidimicrobiales bacterium]
MLLEERRALEAIAASPSLPHRAVREAKGLLLAGDGVANTAIAERLGVSRSTVLSWRAQFVEDGVEGVGVVRPGRGRKPTISQDAVEQLVRDTQHTTPADATHWSVRSMAKHAGISKSKVQQIWSARGLKPHLVETFKLSNDPDFDDKLVDVVGLYMNPPEGAVVLSVDEKSQIQALNRTQPSLPMKPGRAGTLTHDYKRNGTTTLFAALNVLSGVVLGKCLPKHRNTEFVRFLRLIDRRVDKGLQVHLIVDNYGTHKHPNVEAWLAQHPRFHLHFIPTSSSWLNLVERWFRDLTTKRLQRGSFANVPELVAAIEDYIAHHNDDPKPFVWTKSADEIIAKVKRGRVALDQARAN